MTVAFLQKLDSFGNKLNEIGRIPVLSTFSAVVIRFPYAIVATVTFFVVKFFYHYNQRVTQWNNVAVYNFKAMFGELIPGLNILFHQSESVKKEWVSSLFEKKAWFK